MRATVDESYTGFVPGLAFFDMQEELSGIPGRNVNLNTPDFLSPCFRHEALRVAEEHYAAP
ncbi:MAG TPA: hypothetical protein VME18_06380 [Acidobacteriaceae bacterium]|nr:hypothetical protein [Acidobacteriaceae bacterium]